jgi:hypothetical protein
VLVASSGVQAEPVGCCYYRQGVPGGSLSGRRSHAHMLSRLRSVESKAHTVLPRVHPTRVEQACRGLARQYMDVAFHAWPSYPDLVKQCEEHVARFGTPWEPLFDYSRVGGLFERLVGWKATRRASVIARSVWGG